ncbi:MAG: nicotinate-nucleotide adenylyltransferase [Lachnospiraceae bacterium]
MCYNRRVGILGGTFDPIHIGHLLLAESARDYFNLDEVLFIPSGHSYMKENVSEKQFRASVTAKAIENNPCFTLSRFEFNKSGNSYSYETVSALATQNPMTEYYFIIGGDTIFALEEWQHPELLFANCIIVAGIRKGYSLQEIQSKIASLQKKYSADIRLFTTARVDVSSTDIRDRINLGQSIQYMVPDIIKDDILKHYNHIGDVRDDGEDD